MYVGEMDGDDGMGGFKLKKLKKLANPIAVTKKVTKGHLKVLKKVGPVAVAVHDPAAAFAGRKLLRRVR